MAGISSSTGVVSGIDYKTLITQLMAIESKPKTLLQSRIKTLDTKKLAYADIQTRLTSLRVSATTLKKPSTLGSPTTTTSNEDVITATAAAGTIPGSYQFQVARLVSTQQSITTGFATFDKTKVGSSTLSLSAGDGKLSRQAKLYQLNGGTGIGAGFITITDRKGNTADISTSGATNLDQIINRINADATIEVTASLTDEGLKLVDTSGGTGNFKVVDKDAEKSATKLGIVADVAGDTITGTDINYVGAATKIQDLNDGRGVRTAAGSDFRITFADNSTIDVNLTSMNTVQDVLTAINNASGNLDGFGVGGAKVEAKVDNAGNGIILVDKTGGNSLTVSALNSSNAAKDLGILGSSSGATLTGQPLLASLNTVFVASLNGAQGLNLGQFSITNKAGTSTNIDLTGSVTVKDILTKINAANAGVTASLNDAGNGIQLLDTTNSENSPIVVAEVGGGTTASQLKLLGTYSGTKVAKGGNLGLAKVTAGSLTIEQGGGELNTPTLLSQLNGGAGVRRGSFRITDKTGKAAVIDITAAVTVDDVLKKINNSLDLDLKATATNKGISITDQSGGAGSLVITDIGGGSTAKDLGILGSTAGATLTGSTVYKLGATTALNTLNDNRGVRLGAGGADFRVTFADASTVDVDLSSAKTMADVVRIINDSAGNKLTASLSGSSLQLSTGSGSTGTFTVSAQNGSNAAKDLGILGTSAVTTPGASALTGADLLGGIDTVMLSSLNGGAGLTPGAFQVTNRNGVTTNVDLSAAYTVQDMIDRINASGAGVTASLNNSGNGLQLADSTGGTGNLTIQDNAFTQALGINGVFDTSVGTVSGKNLQRQFINENTALSAYNFSKGINLGSFRITNSKGLSATIDLTAGTYTTLNDIIKKINGAVIPGSTPTPLNVTASINDTGDGIKLTDNAAGTLQLKVEDVKGTSAADLHIAGTSTGTTIDGTLEQKVDVDVDDTLATIQTKINNLNTGIRAAIINDGSGANAFRMTLTAANSGYAGRVSFDAGTTQLGTSALVEAQDAAVFVGSSTAAQPVLITAAQNQISGIVPGLTVDLHGVSAQPVTVNVSKTADKAADEIKKFVETFNTMMTKVKEYTKFDLDPTKKGVLLGDAMVQTVQSDIYRALNTSVPSAGKYRVLADVGLKLGDGATLTFDEDKFRSAAASDPDALEKLFTSFTTTTTGGKTTSNPVGVMATIEDRLNKLLDPVNGIVTRTNKTIDNQTQDFNDRIKSLDKILEQKQSRLERQFAGLESVLAKMQSQQSSIGSLANLKTA